MNDMYNLGDLVTFIELDDNGEPHRKRGTVTALEAHGRLLFIVLDIGGVRYKSFEDVEHDVLPSGGEGGLEQENVELRKRIIDLENSLEDAHDRVTHLTNRLNEMHSRALEAEARFAETPVSTLPLSLVDADGDTWGRDPNGRYTLIGAGADEPEYSERTYTEVTLRHGLWGQERE